MLRNTTEPNKPVNMEALKQEQNGVLLLSCLQPSDVGLHGDQFMLDKTLPQVVHFSSIYPVQNQQIVSV